MIIYQDRLGTNKGRALKKRVAFANQTNKTSGGLRITQCGDADCIDSTLRTSQTVLTGTQTSYRVH